MVLLDRTRCSSVRTTTAEAVRKPGSDASETYTLDLTGITPHPQQGWHVKLLINAEGSQGADTKFKVFWVTRLRAADHDHVDDLDDRAADIELDDRAADIELDDRAARQSSSTTEPPTSSSTTEPPTSSSSTSMTSTT